MLCTIATDSAENGGAQISATEFQVEFEIVAGVVNKLDLGRNSR